MCPQCLRPTAVRLLCAISYHGGLASAARWLARPGCALVLGSAAASVLGAARVATRAIPHRRGWACAAAWPPCPAAGREPTAGGVCEAWPPGRARLPGWPTPVRGAAGRPPPARRWAPVNPDGATGPGVASPRSRALSLSASWRRRERRMRSNKRRRIALSPWIDRPPGYDESLPSSPHVTECNLLRSARRARKTRPIMARAGHLSG
jgi:hypothetical protein